MEAEIFEWILMEALFFLKGFYMDSIQIPLDFRRSLGFHKGPYGFHMDSDGFYKDPHGFL